MTQQKAEAMEHGELIARLEDWAKIARRGGGPTWFQKDVGPLLDEAARALRTQDQGDGHG